VQLGLASLPETVGVTNNAVFAVELASHNLKKKSFEGVKHLAVFGKCQAGIVSTEVQQAAFIRGLTRNAQVQSEISHQLA